MTTRWAPAKKDTMREIATEIAHNYPRGRVVVAVDSDASVDGAAFSDDLVVALGELGRSAFRASTVDFAKATDDGAGTGVEEARRAESLDESVLRRVLLEPFRLGGSTGWVPKAFDAVAGRAVQADWVTGPADALLVIDGTALNRPSLAGGWNYSLWLTADRARTDLRARAMAVVDVSDPEHPRRVFDDAC
ncbi:hypothetical protein ACPEEZ_08825 [Frigoribacterium sp. 2-23]|uniref:hypothetical protein n=1 Tax=Frigoribacterium sp. 2-23 TaxID=3415006 RepID=UPI003C6EFD77